MPSPQDYELFLKANPRVQRPRNAAEKMALAGAVAEHSRNYAKAPSQFQEKGKALAEGLKSIGSAGLLLSLGAGATAAFGRKTSDNYEQSTTPNQTDIERANRGEAREDFTENYRNVATQLSEEQGFTDNPPSNIPTAPPDTPKASVGPKSSGARPTLVRNAAEEFLLRRSTQEAEEPSVDFPDDMEPNETGGTSAKFQSIRTLPTGGVGYQFEAKDLLGNKKSKGKPNIQYEVEPSGPLSPRNEGISKDVRQYGVNDGEASYRVGDRKGQMSPLAANRRYLRELIARNQEVDYEDNESKMKDLIGGGTIGTKKGPRPSAVIKAVQTGNYSSIFPDDDGPKLDGGGSAGGNIPPSPTDTPDAGTGLSGGGKKGPSSSPDPWFDNLSDKGVDRLLDRMDELGAREDNKNEGPKSTTKRAENLLSKMNSRREGDMAQDGPNKPAYEAKQRIARKTQEKTNPLSTLDKVLSKKQPDNSIARGVQNLVGTGEVITDIAKRGVQDTKEVVDNITTKASNFIDKQYQNALETRDNIGDEQYRQEGLTKFKEAAAREREIRGNLNKGGAGLTPEQKSAAIRKMMTDEGYGDYLS